MKKQFFTLIFFLPLISFGQGTHHFPHQNASWGNFSGSWGIGINGGTNFYVADGDTVVDGTGYFKIKIVDSASLWQSQTVSLLREDSSENIFVRNTNAFDSTEHLLYKFNVQPNDTIKNLYNDMGEIQDYVVVDSIGYVSDYYGVKRKAVWLSPHNENGCTMYEPLIWIEGIGSNSGLFNPKGVWISDALAWLTCFSENDSVKFYECSVCNLWLGSDLIKQEGIKIFPVPANDFLQLVLKDFKLTKSGIAFYDITGHEIFPALQAVSEDSVKVKTGDLVAGVYIVLLKTGGENLIKKFLVEHHD